MSTKNVKLKDANGDYLYPKTLGSLVVKADGTTVWAEEGAQVNVLEGVTVNSTDLSISSKKASLSITMYKKTTATSGYAATYQLKVNNTAVGDDINIPKDMVVSDGSVVDVVFKSSDSTLHEGSESGTDVTVEITGSATASASDAGKYIKLTIANASATHLWVKVDELIDTYTAGNGLNLNNGTFSVKLTSGESNLVVDSTGLHLSSTAASAISAAGSAVTYEVIT